MESIFFKILIGLRKIFSNSGIGKIPGVVQSYNKIFNRLKPKGIAMIKMHGLSVFINTNDIGMSQQLLERGVYEEYETEIVTGLIKPGMTVVNVGANFGYYALLCSKLVGPQGKVYAFEPETNNFELLVKNIENNNLTNVIAVPCAVGSSNGSLSLYTDLKNVGNPSLSKLNVPNLKEEISVPVVTLDQYFTDSAGGNIVDVIHMDVQGSEASVLLGAQNIMTKQKPIIIMEFWPFGLSNMDTDPKIFLETIENNGFSIQVIDESVKKLKNYSTAEIIDLCLQRKNGRGFVNLLLKK